MDDPTPSRWDVIVVGGALSGASTACLLLRRNPRLRVLILERTTQLKRRVGESTVEISAYFLGRVLGLSQASVTRLFQGTFQLDPASKPGELALLLVRLFHSLDSIVGSPEAARAWLASDNLGLNGVPRELILDVRGLVHVTDYLDAHRARG